ncbi:tetratricopeptide repeat protein [Ferrovibrio sp.]|uniref:tetratricopeptide repeat protein n=1 Tax=Ferrovibrio sp. TaxID=1917215 RepID=UPI003D2AD6D0
MTRLGFSRQLVATTRCCLLACLVALSMPLAAMAASNDQQQAARRPISIAQLRRDAEAGDANAQYMLGVAYVRGEAVARDLTQAKIWLERAATQDDGEPSFRLGVYHAMGIWGKRDAEQAFRWIERSAQHGDPAPLRVLGNFYLTGFGTSRNVPLGIELLTKAANQGDAGAQYNLGAIYLAGEVVPKDRVQARAWFIKSYEAGDAEAAAMVSETYRGEDWKKYEKEIFKWMSAAAQGGSIKGQKYLCDFYYNGVGTARDVKKAFEQCLLVANHYAELKDPDARFLETSLHNRRNREENTRRIYDAAYWVAAHLYYGEVVPRDCLAGRMWLTRIIDSDDEVDITETRAKAMRYLALDYKNGCSVKRNDAEAKRLIDAAEVLVKEGK